jgi:hypothetical protein
MRKRVARLQRALRETRLPFRIVGEARQGRGEGVEIAGHDQAVLLVLDVFELGAVGIELAGDDRPCRGRAHGWRQARPSRRRPRPR